jgi:monoamine oxidase
MAGLAAANALVTAGVDVVVLEARDRIGGRLHTFDLGGSPVDLGGSWIHTPIGNPMSAWAEQVGVERRPAHLFEVANAWDSTDGRRLEATEFAWLREQSDRQLRAVIDDLLRRTGGDVSVAEAIEAFIDRARLPPDRARHVRWAIRRFTEGDASGRAEEVSARWLRAYGVEYGGDLFGDMPIGGYRHLLEPLADRLDVRLSTPVGGIAMGADRVRVSATTGETFEASHAIVTVPLGVLKAGAIEFVPPLASERVAAIARLGFGRFEKVALRVDGGSWPADSWPNILVVSEMTASELPVVMSLEPFTGEPVLVAYAFGSSAGLIRDASEREAAERVLELVERVTGKRPRAPDAIVRTSWADDPFTRGAYGYVALGSKPDDFDLLGEPVGGRLLFAGEATSRRRVGYADGAFSSGIREAKRLLQVEEVELRSP